MPSGSGSSRRRADVVRFLGSGRSSCLRTTRGARREATYQNRSRSCHFRDRTAARRLDGAAPPAGRGAHVPAAPLRPRAAAPREHRLARRPRAELVGHARRGHAGGRAVAARGHPLPRAAHPHRVHRRRGDTDRAGRNAALADPAARNPGRRRGARPARARQLLDEISFAGLAVLDDPDGAIDGTERVDPDVVERVRQSSFLRAEAAWERSHERRRTSTSDGETPHRVYRQLRLGRGASPNANGFWSAPPRARTRRGSSPRPRRCSTSRRPG